MNDSIILYSMPGCPRCRGLKMQLDSAGLQYEEKHDEEYLKSLNLTQPPYLMVNGELLSAVDAVR